MSRLAYSTEAVARLLFVAALCLAMAAPASVPHAQEFEYKLGPGDRVRVTVFGHQDLSGDFEVGAGGALSLPLIGEIRARGLTLKDLEGAIVDKLRPDYLKNPSVAIDVLNYRPFFIIGEVKQPGGYPYVSGMRVVEAVALAGGFTYRARENDILIRRAGDPDGETRPADQATIVLPGDVIEVPQRFF